MWMVVYVAQTKEQAEALCELLKNASILVKMRAVNQSESEKFGCYEIMVPEAELNEAHEVIISKMF